MKKRTPNTRRSAYFYICIGGCGRKRVTFDFARFTRKECARCENDKPDPNQATLI